MWIFMNDSMLSIVEYQKVHNQGSEFLMVRSRSKGDIKRVFPEAHEVYTPNNDYAYRAVIPKTEVAVRLAQRIGDIDYPNFKNSVKGKLRHKLYTEIWWQAFLFVKERIDPLFAFRMNAKPTIVEEKPTGTVRYHKSNNSGKGTLPLGLRETVMKAKDAK